MRCVIALLSILLGTAAWAAPRVYWDQTELRGKVGDIVSATIAVDSMDTDWNCIYVQFELLFDDWPSHEPEQGLDNLPWRVMQVENLVGSGIIDFRWWNNLCSQSFQAFWIQNYPFRWSGSVPNGQPILRVYFRLQKSGWYRARWGLPNPNCGSQATDREIVYTYPSGGDDPQDYAIYDYPGPTANQRLRVGPEIILNVSANRNSSRPLYRELLEP